MNDDTWDQIIRINFTTLMAEHFEALKAGMTDPVIVMIDVRKGQARKFALNHAAVEAEEGAIDDLAAKATGEAQVPIYQIAMERSEVADMLSDVGNLEPVDHQREFWVMCLEADDAGVRRLSRWSPDCN